ncbi:MAG: sulfotransferase domain-containing protein [Phycisphaerales bacterium JB043]
MYVVVSEYPKAGGTWLSKMLADVLRLPLPIKPFLPLGFPCVIHNHWVYNPRFHRPVYLYRDGRDVMVSFFFHRMRALATMQYFGHASDVRKYDRLFGKGYDPNDARGLLPRFIEHEFAHPHAARLNWRQHAESWMRDKSKGHIGYVSYEALRHNTHEELARLVTHITAREPDSWDIDTAIEKFSMERQTGRKPGDEDTHSFIRKGIAGDWKNHFTRESGELFNDLGGDALVDLGYETDRQWTSRVSFVDDR